MRLVPVGGSAARQRAGRPARAMAGTVLAAAVVLLAAGCHVPGTASSAAGAPPVTVSSVTVAAIPGPADAPLYIAVQQGLFQKQGLTVNIRSYSSSTAELAALRDHTVDIAVGDYGEFFSAQTKQPDMVLLADGYDAASSVMEVLTLPGSGITNARKLQSQTIGTPQAQEIPFSASNAYSLTTAATRSVLDTQGVNQKLVHWKAMPPQDLVGALRTHQVNAILVTEPQIYQAESQLGAVEVLDACSGATASLPLSGYFAMHSFAKKNPGTLTAFRSALEQGQADAALAGPVQQALQKYAGLTPAEASLVTLGQYPTSLKASNLQRVASLLFFYGALPSGPLNVGSMIFR